MVCPFEGKCPRTLFTLCEKRRERKERERERVKSVFTRTTRFLTGKRKGRFAEPLLARRGVYGIWHALHQRVQR